MNGRYDKPRRRKKDLAVQNLLDEVLVYDLRNHRAHRLNRAAAMVWRHCDGKTTISQLARILADKLDEPADREVVRYALSRLGRVHLLEGEAQVEKYSRRDFIHRLKKVGLAASVMLPVVSSIVAPTPAHAMSCVPAGDCGAAGNCTPCHSGNPGLHSKCKSATCCCCVQMVSGPPIILLTSQKNFAAMSPWRMFWKHSPSRQWKAHPPIATTPPQQHFDGWAKTRNNR